jgi:acyl carrier protein
MTQEKTIKVWIQEVLNVHFDKITPEVTFKELGATKADIFEICLHIEEKLKIEIPYVESSMKIKDFYQLVETQINKK